MKWIACAETEERKCIVHLQETEISVSGCDWGEKKKTAGILMAVYKIQTWSSSNGKPRCQGLLSREVTWQHMASV